MKEIANIYITFNWQWTLFSSNKLKLGTCKHILGKCLCHTNSPALISTRLPAFYTSSKGYKMCIRVDANGDGDAEDTHVSVFTFLMKGENNDHLPWPFTGKVTVELLNQLEDKNHLSKSLTFTSDNASIATK
jgi:hypothetical protein